MKKIMAILSRDIKSGLRDWLILYLTLAPIMIAIILRVVVPGVSDTNLNIAIIDSLDNELIRYLEDFSKIETYSTIDAIEERVLRMDDVFGIASENGEILIIAQGNELVEMRDALEFIIAKYYNQSIALPVRVQISDIGWRESPVKIEGTNILLLFTSVFGGMLILLSIVEEKMSNTLNSINVSTVTRVEFIIGKSILGFLMPIFGSIGALLILQFSNVNYLHLVITLVAIALISVVMGFAIGVYNSDPIAAIASMKGLFLPLIISVAGAIFLSDKMQFLLYWSPFYWAYNSINSILLNESTTSSIVLNSVFIVIISGIVFALLRKRIERGFN